MSLFENAPESLVRARLDAPRLVMWACLATVIAAGWAWMVAMSGLIGGGVLRDLWLIVCRPVSDPWSPTALLGVFAMWAAMSLAMMLPAAVPMLRTYMDIEQAAREKTMTIVPAGVLAAGYACVWLAFSVAAALLQAGLQSVSALTADFALASHLAGGAVMVVAGLWQLTPLRHACLTKCRQPMSYFLMNWSDRTRDVFRMGAGQGLWCLACCWALMLMMFTTGVMNLLWMAGLSMLAILERTLARPEKMTKFSGFFLIACGLAVMASGLTTGG